MTQRANILQELSKIGSTLINAAPQNLYSVPPGYFEGFADQMMNRIQSIESNDDLYFSLLSNISKETPYSIPTGYFDGLENKLMQAIRENADYQTAHEELASISPLLNGLKKEMPYSVPQEYFENLNADKNLRPKAKVISLVHQKWFKYAAAAVVISIIAIGVVLNNNGNSAKPFDETRAWAKVEKKVKTLSDKEIKDYVEFSDNGLNAGEGTDLQPVKKEEIKDLLKDVSDTDLKKFLDQTSDGSEDDLSLN